VLDVDAHKPPGLRFLAIDHLAQKAIVAVIDCHKLEEFKPLRSFSNRPLFAA
jgi:hypothetical protein